MASKSLAVRSLFYEERQKRGSSGLGVSFLLDFLTGMVLCKDTEKEKSNCLFYLTGSVYNRMYLLSYGGNGYLSAGEQ